MSSSACSSAILAGFNRSSQAARVIAVSPDKKDRARIAPGLVLLTGCERHLVHVDSIAGAIHGAKGWFIEIRSLEPRL